MKTFNVYHVSREDSLADRRLNEYGDERPASQIFVGQVETPDDAGSGTANRIARGQFPAPATHFVFCREANSDPFASLTADEADRLANPNQA